MKKIFLIPAVLMLGACSIFGGGNDEEIIFDTALGPKTSDQAKYLPKTLAGDKENANYSSTAVKSANLESEDGSGNE